MDPRSPSVLHRVGDVSVASPPRHRPVSASVGTTTCVSRLSTSCLSAAPAARRAPAGEPGFAYQTLMKRMARAGFTAWEAVREDEVAQAHPFPFTLLLRHLVSRDSGCGRVLEHVLRAHPWFMVEPDDGRFVAGMMRVAKAEFNIAHALRPDQFMRPGAFFDAKVAFVSDVAKAWLAKAQALSKAERPTPDTSRRSIASAGSRAVIPADPSGAAAPAKRCLYGAPGSARGALFREMEAREAAMQQQLAELERRHRDLACQPRTAAPPPPPSTSVQSGSGALVVGPAEALFTVNVNAGPPAGKRRS